MYNFCCYFKFVNFDEFQYQDLYNIPQQTFNDALKEKEVESDGQSEEEREEEIENEMEFNDGVSKFIPADTDESDDVGLLLLKTKYYKINLFILLG